MLFYFVSRISYLETQLSAIAATPDDLAVRAHSSLLATMTESGKKSGSPLHQRRGMEDYRY
jgi:hypothetical protein